MQTFLAISRALGDENRVRALMALRHEELCLCQIIDLLGLAPSTVSKHMSLLLEAGLVERRKQGRWHFYRLAGGEGSETVRRALEWMAAAIGDDPSIQADRRQLQVVCQRDLEELALCYRS